MQMEVGAMTKTDTDFDDWYTNLQVHLLDRAGVEYRDADAARVDYDAGRDVFDVVDQIAAEYES